MKNVTPSIESLEALIETLEKEIVALKRYIERLEKYSYRNHWEAGMPGSYSLLKK
jgi:hypothetical protein